MKSFEEIHQANQERILKHICLIALHREPSSDESIKLNIMMDLGKTIPEILASLRKTSDDSKNVSFDVNTISPVANSRISVNVNDSNSLRTPLEMYYHRYVSS